MIGRNREEAELSKLLASTLVAREVIEPMNKIGWGHGTPPAPDYSGQPAPAEGAPPQAAPVTTPEQSGQPAKPVVKTEADPQKADAPDLAALMESLRGDDGLIMGKYATIEAALKGAGHLANMAKQAFTREEEARKELEALRAGTLQNRQTHVETPLSTATQSVSVNVDSRNVDTAQARLDEVLSSINENGGVLDETTSKELSRAQRELAEAVGDARVQEYFAKKEKSDDAEKNAWAAVDRYMSEKHPDSMRFSEEVALYVQSESLLKIAVQALLERGDRRAATELAWTTFEKVHGAQKMAELRSTAEDKEADLAAREQVRNEKVATARKDAGVVTGSSGGSGVHENAAIAGNREEIEAARAQMQREGEAPGSPAAVRFRQLVIGPSLGNLFGS